MRPRARSRRSTAGPDLVGAVDDDVARLRLGVDDRRDHLRPACARPSRCTPHPRSRAPPRAPPGTPGRGRDAKPTNPPRPRGRRAGTRSTRSGRSNARSVTHDTSPRAREQTRPATNSQRTVGCVRTSISMRCRSRRDAERAEQHQDDKEEHEHVGLCVERRRCRSRIGRWPRGWPGRALRRAPRRAGVRLLVEERRQPGDEQDQARDHRHDHARAACRDSGVGPRTARRARRARRRPTGTSASTACTALPRRAGPRRRAGRATVAPNARRSAR